MKFNHFILSLLCICLVSCKKDQSETESTQKENYTVIIEGVFEKNDKIQLFYLTERNEWSDDNSVIMPVYGSTSMQKIELELPEKIAPTNIRFDISENASQTHVTLKNISVIYKNHKINGDYNNYETFFYPNEFITWDSEYFGYKLNKINESFDPYFMGNDVLIAKLENIVSKKAE